MSALAVHGLVENEVTRLSVTVPRGRRVRTSRWLRVHRSDRAFAVVRARGLPATSVPRSLIDTWGDAYRAKARRGYDGVVRAAVIRATRERGTTVSAIRAELDLRPQLAGRAALRQLLQDIADGSQSELEIFGARHVLAVPGLPTCQRQCEVRLAGGNRVFLDAAWPEVKVAVELDGAAFHGSQEARERDLQRDAALAALGWVVLRFSYRQVMRDPAGCRAQIAAVYRQRLGMVR
jgi:hypothetical protein